VTLIELLVVVAVLAILLAMSLTMVRPVMKDMKVREASRMLNAYLAGIQARAVELDRPVAAYIEVRREQSATGTPTNAAFQVFHAESPPPYAGDMADARIIIPFPSELNPNEIVLGVGLARFDVTRGDTPDFEFDDPLASGALMKLCEPGDLIQFGFKGPWYEIKEIAADPNNPFYVSVIKFNTLNHGNPPPGTVPYQIRRKPRKSLAAPLDLPAPMVVDVGVSGIGPNTAFYQNQPVTTPHTVPLIISFSPQGGIDMVYVGRQNTTTGARTYDLVRPSSAVHLLVGWVDKMSDIDGDGAVDNLTDSGNRWVSIGNLTGRITTSKNAGIDGQGDSPYAKARYYAKDAQGVGVGG
jgi:type II secretory pathway pseudopilin PulG